MSFTTALPTRPLGRSGLEITRVGFGSWAVGGGGWSFGWGPQDDSESLATMLANPGQQAAQDGCEANGGVYLGGQNTCEFGMGGP